MLMDFPLDDRPDLAVDPLDESPTDPPAMGSLRPAFLCQFKNEFPNFRYVN